MATVARTKQDVDQMDKRERLWDSLNHAYGLQRESSDREFDKAISQADRQMLSRGMQRSSYGSQVLGNLGSQKVKAQNDIWNNQIADYENRLGTLEQQEAEDERWTKQFEEGVRQFNENLAYQREENAAAREYNTAERLAQQIYNTSERVAQQNYNAEQNALARAFQTGEREAQQAYNTSEREAQQLYNTAEREAQQNYQSGENALTRAENARQFNEQLGYNREQAAVAADQWERQFAQNNMTDDQKLAASYVSAIIANGQIPSDELLARAGLSRADAELMAKQAASGGPGPGKSDDDGGENPPPGDPGNLISEELLARLKGAWDNTFGTTPTTPSRVSTVVDDKAKAAYQEAKKNNFAGLPIVDFSGKSPTGWTTQQPAGPTQNVGVAMNTEEIKKRKQQSESLVNKPHINI